MRQHRQRDAAMLAGPRLHRAAALSVGRHRAEAEAGVAGSGKAAQRSPQGAAEAASAALVIGPRISHSQDWLKNLPADGVREMCSWERFCAFAREPERRQVGGDARISVGGTL